MSLAEAVAAVKAFVASDAYDGSIEANFELDKLMWSVRWAHPYNHHQPQMRQPEPADPALDLDDLEIDLTELGL